MTGAKGAADSVRLDWSRAEVAKIYDLPFHDLLFRAQKEHRRRFDPNVVEIATLLSLLGLPASALERPGGRPRA